MYKPRSQYSNNRVLKMPTVGGLSGSGSGWPSAGTNFPAVPMGMIPMPVNPRMCPPGGGCPNDYLGPCSGCRQGYMPPCQYAMYHEPRVVNVHNGGIQYEDPGNRPLRSPRTTRTVR